MKIYGNTLEKMEVDKQIETFKNFLERFYINELSAACLKGESSLRVDFSVLAKFNIELADLLLEEPEDLIKAFELSVCKFDFAEKIKDFKIRFFNIPNTQSVSISEIRKKHLHKLYKIDGLIRRKSDVRPQVISAKFECSCGNIINILQSESQFKEPSKCGCGAKSRFKLLYKELIDTQELVLEESPDSLKTMEQPRKISVLLKYDLVSTFSERKTSPGSKVEIIGMIYEVPIITRTGTKSTRFDLIIDANNVESLSTSFYDLSINNEEEKEIIKFSREPEIYEKIISSIAPSIYGYKEIKEAIMLQLFGGVRKTRIDKVISRGDFHILLVGDPGAGKSALVKRVATIAPKGRYVSGKGASGTGLTACVVKDEFSKGYALEAGAMVLCSDGLCVIDEMDKMTEEDRSAMHEAMENQTVSISKANIQATLTARTSVLASANPKMGRFEMYDLISNQIDMPPTLINRFDLIFPIIDSPDSEKDSNLAEHMLNLHENPLFVDGEVSTDFLKKYIAYAKQKIHPVLTKEAREEIKKYYLRMRSSGSSSERRIIPITPRQLEALIRMSEASAKVCLSNKVMKEDSKRAISLLQYCLERIGFDKEAGKIDIDRVSATVSYSERNKIILVKEILMEMFSINKEIEVDSLIETLKEKNIKRVEAESILAKLKHMGEIFEPKNGFIRSLQ